MPDPTHTQDAPRSAVLLVHAGAPSGGLTALGKALAQVLPERWRVVVAMLDGHPDIGSAVADLAERGARELVVIPAQPHFAAVTTGRALRALYGALRDVATPLELATHPSWHDDAGFVSALARLVADFTSARDLSPDRAFLCFVAPAPPETSAGPSDPYRAQLRRSAELVADRVGWPRSRMSVSFTAPHRPSADGAPVVVCPLSSVVETGDPVPGVHVCPPPHTFPPFLAALKRLVLKGARPVPPGKKPPEPLLRTAGTGERDVRPHVATRLVMAGASVPGTLGPGEGPPLRHSDPRVFARVRKSHQEVGAFLDWMREATPAREAFLWNTCQRTELYAWLPEPWDGAERAALMARIRRELFGSEPEGLEVLALEEGEARHHLLRTACGLNSDLPGDRDVASQLQTALRRAQGAGTAAGLALELVEDAVAVAADVNEHTSFGRFGTGYCAAALRRICEADGLQAAHLRHVTIGGSTTSRSVLVALREDHDVPPGQLTAIYRDHHGQMKQLRSAVGGGRRLRVHAYHDERVVRAVADADVVYFGIDQPEAVLDPIALAGLRDFRARPLTLVDFNSFGSLAGPPPEGVRIWPARELEDAVAAHAAITATQAGFAGAVREAEAWISRHVAWAGTSPC